MKNCEKMKEDSIENVIKTLPKEQQEGVKACFQTAKAANTKQRRYTLEWMYECLLMRIKSKKCYDHIRKRNILPLPCPDTLNKHLQSLDSSAYGFQSAIFNCLRLKASKMELSERRGALLVDEMKLSEAISFNRSTLLLNGLVYLGENVPGKIEGIQGDHALVFMFQPFRGAWVQVLGCFLSRNAVTSEILHKLVLECIILLSNSGFHVDVVTTDGAAWNRKMWKLFGITLDNISCEHPCDKLKRLYFISDFPHLIKCFRNGIVQQKQFWTPDGIVKMDHWKALLELENYPLHNLRIAYKLTPSHLNPKGYQKMNVPLAFGLFAESVHVAMAFYQNKEACSQLKDSTPTQQFIKRMNMLISAMMSRTPKDALRLNDTNIQQKTVLEFEQYLNDWENHVQREKLHIPISHSTMIGLKITLRATINILQTLQEECNFQYLMTARLNQDALERFFGMMRNACGSNDHPDPLLFTQVFRLLCTYSLVKPPKGSNVSGSEILSTLMKKPETVTDKPSKDLWLEKLAALLEGRLDLSEQTLDDIDKKVTDPFMDHNYNSVSTSDEVQAYLAGYVVHKIGRSTKCALCSNSLRSECNKPRDKVVDLMSHGGLSYASDQLFNLTKMLEKTVLDVVSQCGIKLDIFYIVLDRFGEMKHIPSVGCKDHKKELTIKVIHLYLVMRGHFLTKSTNAKNNERRIKTKSLRKNAKI